MKSDTPKSVSSDYINIVTEIGNLFKVLSKPSNKGIPYKITFAHIQMVKKIFGSGFNS